MEVLINQVFNQTQTVTVRTIGGDLPLTFFLNQTTDTEIGIMVSTLKKVLIRLVYACIELWLVLVQTGYLCLPISKP